MLEIIVDGTPRSLQGKGPSLTKWKSYVRDRAKRQVPEDSRLDYVDVAVQLLHFCRDWRDLDGDLDNIAKPLLDAIVGVAIFNDNQVKQILLRRTETERHQITLISGATERLAQRLDRLLTDETDIGFVYILVEASIDHTRL